MAISPEDKADVKRHLGKALANKVADATRDHSGSYRKGNWHPIGAGRVGDKYKGGTIAEIDAKNARARVTKDTPRKVNLIPDRRDVGHTTFKRVDSTNVTAKDYPTKRRALRGIAEKQESYASGNKGMYDANRAGYRKTHRERQKSGEAGTRGYRPYRRED